MYVINYMGTQRLYIYKVIFNIIHIVGAGTDQVLAPRCTHHLSVGDIGSAFSLLRRIYTVAILIYRVL